MEFSRSKGAFFVQLSIKKSFQLVSAFLLVWLSVRLLLPIAAPFLFGLVLALAAEPVVSTLHSRWKLPRGISTGIGVSATFFLISVILLLLCTFAVRELGKLALLLPRMAEPIQAGLDQLQLRLLGIVHHSPRNLQPILQEKIASIFTNGTALLDQTVRYILGFAGSLLGHIPDSALTLGTAILSAYMISAKLPLLRSQLRSRLLSQERIQTLLSVLGRLRRVASGWLRAQCKLMGITFCILLAGFFGLRIPRPLMTALGVTLVDVLPVLGTGTILIPWSLIKLMGSDIARGLGLLGIYLTVTLIRSGLEPKLLGRQLGMDPLLTLISLYVGFKLWGIGGMILAPLLAVTVLQALPQGQPE